MVRKTSDERRAAVRLLARSLLAEALGVSPAPLRPDPVLAEDTRRQWTPAMSLQATEAFLQREGHFPAYLQWKQAGRYGLPAFDTVRRYWGSTAELRQAVQRQQRLRLALSNTEHEENHGNHLEISD